MPEAREAGSVGPQRLAPRSGAAAGRLAWGLGALAVTIAAAATALYLAGPGFPGERLFTPVGVVVFSVIGALIASRHPRNAIGWIFCGAAMASAVGMLCAAYARYWLDGHGGSRAFGEAAAVYGTASWIAAVLMPIMFLLLLFPDGRPLSPRWRAVGWAGALGIGFFFAGEVTHPGPLEDTPELRNPYGIDGSLVEGIMGLGALLALVGVIGAALSLVLRFRRARPEQRQQIKWLMWAGSIAAIALVVGSAGYEVWGADAANLVILTCLLALPVATGIAILRYRLYDVDVVVNRTLVYAGLTVTLAAAYVGSVLLLQVILSPGSDLAIAASTLAVAALFRPARTRIQALVDRRFYRRRYDARRTLEAFGGRLRDEVELEHLNAELRAVVSDTMHPRHVSLWLRERTR